jgi:hypothetical protein
VQLDIVAKQLGHANSMTVSNTYGHLAEQFREEQVRQRFTPLSEDQREEMRRRRNELDGLWSNLQTDDWRRYATVRQASSNPRKSFARPVREVAEVFDLAERASIRE